MAIHMTDRAVQVVVIQVVTALLVKFPINTSTMQLHKHNILPQSLKVKQNSRQLKEENY